MQFATAVKRTPDFRRIEALPRRTVRSEDAHALVDKWTARLAVPGSGARLLPWQAYAFEELERVRGALLGYPVGTGKTLISALAPVVLGSKRSVLIVPAALRDKTYADFSAYRGRWRLPSPLPRVITREELQVEANADLLDRLRPELIIVDEADDLANSEASVPTRISRYRNAMGEACVVLAMTGSLTRKSIMGYWHLLIWCLGAEAPVPIDRDEAKSWAAALDDYRPGAGGRPKPGPLGPSLAAARAWYLKRLSETPGVVLVDGDSCDAPLHVRVRLAPEDSVLDSEYEKFLKTDTGPDGLDVTDPLSRWRIDTQMGGAGLYLKMDPRPPEAWTQARRAFAKFVRAAIQNSQKGSRPIETEAQVVKRFRDHPIVAAWVEIKPTFVPVTTPYWLTPTLLSAAEEWLAESEAPGIVWYGVVEFGSELMRRTALPCFGPQGKDQFGRGLHAAPATNIICSWHANKRGFNLQKWTRMLIAQPPPSAKWIEQIIGRSHRHLQDSAVSVDFLAGSGGALDGLRAMLSEARFAKATTGMTQKVLRTKVMWAIPELTKSNRFRWAQRSDATGE